MPVRREILFIIVVAVALVVPLPSAAADTLPPIGTPAGPVSLASAPEATDGAIPLAAARPEWFTPDLGREIAEAAGDPIPAPPDGPLPGTIGIRPGSWMIAPHGCTMNFIFQKSSSLAIGTAGHCTDHVGRPVTLLTLAPATENPVLVQVGTVLVRRDNGIGDDFALVSIRPELRDWVGPTTAVVGGPCGAYVGPGPETVAHYRHGVGIGTGGTPRAGVALNWKTSAYAWDGVAVSGDSGIPVRVTQLAAAGNLTHLVVSSEWLPGIIAGTRIGRMLQIASGWSLTSSSLCL